MITYLLLCLLACTHGINARPAYSGTTDHTSQIFIVTPQAEVYFDPNLNYQAIVPKTFIKHLLPVAGDAATHDETIIYVPFGPFLNSEARASHLTVEQGRKKNVKQYEQIPQQIQGAIQQASSTVGPQFSEAASAAASAASNAGSVFFPVLFPPAAIGSTQEKSELKTDNIKYDPIPTAVNPPLLSETGGSRRYYSLSPAISHVVGVYAGPVSALHARSIQDSETDQETKRLRESVSFRGSSKLEALNDVKNEKITEPSDDTHTTEVKKLAGEEPEKIKFEEKILGPTKGAQNEFDEKKYDEKRIEGKEPEKTQLLLHDLVEKREGGREEPLMEEYKAQSTEKPIDNASELQKKVQLLEYSQQQEKQHLKQLKLEEQKQQLKPTNPVQENEFQSQPQQNEKQLHSQEKEIEENTEYKQKQEEKLKYEQVDFLKEDFKTNSILSAKAELNKIMIEPEKGQHSLTVETQQKQRAADVRAETLQQSHRDAEEPQKMHIPIGIHK